MRISILLGLFYFVIVFLGLRARYCCLRNFGDANRTSYPLLTHTKNLFAFGFLKLVFKFIRLTGTDTVSHFELSV